VNEPIMSMRPRMILPPSEAIASAPMRAPQPPRGKEKPADRGTPPRTFTDHAGISVLNESPNMLETAIMLIKHPDCGSADRIYCIPSLSSSSAGLDTDGLHAEGISSRGVPQ